MSDPDYLVLSQSIFIRELFDNIYEGIRRDADYCASDEDIEHEFKKAVTRLKNHLMQVALPDKE